MNKQAVVPTSTPITRYLDERGIPYRSFRHPGEVHTLEQGARELGQKPEQIVRSIVFRLSTGGFVMVLVGGERKLAWRAIRQHLGTSRIRIASEAEVLEVTGYPVGAVSPLGTRQHVRILVDRRILQETEISIGSGVRFITIIMYCEDFIQALGQVEIGDFSTSDCET